MGVSLDRIIHQVSYPPPACPRPSCNGNAQASGSRSNGWLASNPLLFDFRSGREFVNRGTVPGGDALPGATQDSLCSLAFQQATGTLKVRRMSGDGEALARVKQRMQAFQGLKFLRIHRESHKEARVVSFRRHDRIAANDGSEIGV